MSIDRKVDRDVTRCQPQHGPAIERTIEYHIFRRRQILAHHESAPIGDFHKLFADDQRLDVDVSTVRFPFSLAPRLGLIRLQQRERSVGEVDPVGFARLQREQPLVRGASSAEAFLEMSECGREMACRSNLFTNRGKRSKESHARTFATSGGMGKPRNQGLPALPACARFRPPTMKKFLPIIFAAALAVPLALSAAPFEGKVNMKMTGPKGEPVSIDYSLKTGKVRMDMMVEGNATSMIMDLNKNEMTMLIPGQPMYMTMPIPDETPRAGDKPDEVTLEKTGEKQKILGYTAEKYISKSNNTTTELWLTDQLGSFIGFSGPGPMSGGRRKGGNSGSQAWEKALKGKELFPLRAVGKSADGKETFQLEVTAVEKQSMADTVFAPPAGYQKFDMGGMMKSMGK